MPTLTTTPRPAEAAVDLQLTDAAGIRAVLRSDPNGTREVRLPAGVLPRGGTVTFTDWEPALAQVFYHTDDGAAEAWADLRAVPGPVFSSPFLPALRSTPAMVTRYSATRPGRSIAHEVMGREDSLVILRRMGTYTGSMQVAADTKADLSGLESLLARGEVLLYRQSEEPGADLYFVPEGYTVTADPGNALWTVDLSFREVTRPAGAVRQVEGWTFAQLKRAGGSFGAVTGDYRSFMDLAAGVKR